MEYNAQSLSDCVVAGSATFTSESGFFDGLFPPVTEMTYDILVGPRDDPKGKAVVESIEDMKRLAEGLPVDVNWYRKTADGWEFIERRSLSFTFKGASE